jgi:hypothetical protein
LFEFFADPGDGGHKDQQRDNTADDVTNIVPYFRFMSFSADWLSQFRMLLIKPGFHLIFEVVYELYELLGIIFRRNTRTIVFCGVSLNAARIQVVCILLLAITENQGKRSNRSIMM